MQAAPLIEWPEPIFHLVDFVGLFLTAGAVGFRYSSLRGRVGRGAANETLAAARPGSSTHTALYETAARRGAVLGLIGSVIALVRIFQELPSFAERAHTTTGGLLASNFDAQVFVTCGALAVIGFLLASARLPGGWALAAAGVVVGTLRGALTGQWTRLVNPMHSLAAGLWIGTLFVMLVVGLALVLRRDTPAEVRGPMAADMVNSFSPLALVCGGLVVIFGVITAWRHLNPLSSLWTTPYGWALIAKLAVVAVVFGHGAWNWRRGRLTLGSEAGARGMQRSATKELTAAGLVLLITAILVTLPSPRRPGAPGGPGGPGGPDGPPPNSTAPAPTATP